VSQPQVVQLLQLVVQVVQVLHVLQVSQVSQQLFLWPNRSRSRLNRPP